jgi:hypothetical protein
VNEKKGMQQEPHPLKRTKENKIDVNDEDDDDPAKCAFFVIMHAHISRAAWRASSILQKMLWMHKTLPVLL